MLRFGAIALRSRLARGSRELFVSDRKKHRNSRAHFASADEDFERALLGEDDENNRTFDPRQDRKTRQLCQQVRRALILALGGECADELLRDVYVESVEPMGGAAQLLVRVVVPRGAAAWDVLARLNDRSARLRTIVAQSICRKRAPALAFVVVPEISQSSDGGER